MPNKLGLQKLFENCEFETRSYSGRGMYGARCLGVEIDNIGEVLSRILIELDENREIYNIEEISRELKNLRQDQMGLNIIIYFPSVEYVQKED